MVCYKKAFQLTVIDSMTKILFLSCIVLESAKIRNIGRTNNHFDNNR